MGGKFNGWLAAAALTTCFSAKPVAAVEGPTAAGPIGGTDIRSGMLPPPGVYIGSVGLAAETRAFVDGEGRQIAAIPDAHLEKQIAAPFLFWVPERQVFGGSIGIGGMLPFVNQCGQLFSGLPDHCTSDVGDAYVEFDWSRSFGTLRSSRYEGAYPILEGLSVLIGVGVVLPSGQFDSSDPTEQAISAGNNTWDVSPTVALTYTTAPIIADGTEFSAKFFWNNYRENAETGYLAGDLLNLDFAVTERIGRFQVGLAGVYARQIEDDRIDGAVFAPDGWRGELLQLGGVINYDLPEHNASIRAKANTSVMAENTVEYWAVILGWIKKY